MHDTETVTENLLIAEAGAPGKFLVKGSLTVANAAALKKALLEIFDRHDAVVVRIDGEAETDLSFLQLLCSACRTALKQGKTFAVKGSLPEQYRLLLQEAGYSRQQGCSLDTKQGCLWIPGAEL